LGKIKRDALCTALRPDIVRVFIAIFLLTLVVG